MRYGPFGLYVAACAALGLLSPIGDPFERLSLALGLILWTTAALSSIPAGGWTRLRLVLVCAVAVPVTVLPAEPAARLALISLVALAAPGDTGRAGGTWLGVLAATSLLSHSIPFVWHVFVEMSRLYSRGVTWLGTASIDAGPSVSGMTFLALYLSSYVSWRDTPARHWKLLIAAGLPAIHLLLVPWMAENGGLPSLVHHHQAHAVGERAANALMPLIPLGLLLAWMVPHGPRSRAPFRWRGLAAGLAASIAILAAGLILVTEKPQRRSDRVVFRLENTFDMDVPELGRVGVSRSGMFGLLSDYLSLDGHSVEAVDPPVTYRDLEGAASLVVVLPDTNLPEEERNAIHKFVREGGSLLVLADHTDLLGTMAPINNLLGPTGIRVEFDSAMPIRGEWHGSVAGRAGIGTGASLTLHGQAQPLLTERYAFSDRGNRANIGAGAYLGDYTFFPGERIGDLVLAGEARLGRGRVVVFGDTSSFQNIVLPFSYPFVAGLFDDLARTRLPAGRWVTILLALSALSLALSGRGGAGRFILIAAPLAVLVGTSGLHPVRAPVLPVAPRAPARIALIDNAHCNDFSRRLWQNKSIGGLVFNLQKNGYLPLLSTSPLQGPLPPGGLVVFLAPRCPIGPIEARHLVRHIGEGGDILVATGGDGAGSVMPLLSLFGVAIGHLPLGPVPVRADMDLEAWKEARKSPQFRNAWPVKTGRGTRVRTLYAAFDRNVVVQVQGKGHRSGRLIVMGDSEFLTDSVLENEHDAWEGNVDLFARILSPDRQQVRLR